MELSLSPAIIAAIVAIVIAAGLAHGTLGFGFPIVSTPLVALLVDVKTAVLVTVIPNIALNLISIVRGGNWRESLGAHWRLAIWVVAGTLIGTRILLALRPEPLQLLLAAMIVMYLLQERLRRLDWSWVKRRRRIAEMVFGTAAGLLSGAVNVSLPPLVIYLMTLGLAPIALTQTLNLCFLSGKVVQATSIGLADPASGQLLTASLPLVLIAAVALYVGMRLQRRITVEVYRALLRKALWLMAVFLVVQAAWSLSRN